MFFLFKSPKTVDEMAKVCNTPWKVGFWLWHRVWYKSDLEVHGQREYWQSPEETLDRRTADCDGTAILAKAVLIKLGYIPFLLGVYSANKGHLVCCFFNVRNLYYYTIDNICGLKKRAHHLPDVPCKIKKDCKVWRIYGDTRLDVEEEWVSVSGKFKRTVPKEKK